MISYKNMNKAFKAISDIKLNNNDKAIDRYALILFDEVSNDMLSYFNDDVDIYKKLLISLKELLIKEYDDVVEGI